VVQGLEADEDGCKDVSGKVGPQKGTNKDTK
jgi:hypothetical protein